jgi:hypothetical protein
VSFPPLKEFKDCRGVKAVLVVSAVRRQRDAKQAPMMPDKINWNLYAIQRNNQLIFIFNLHVNLLDAITALNFPENFRLIYSIPTKTIEFIIDQKFH